MQFVDMCMNEKCIDVKYGLYDLREERDTARSSLKYILSDVNDIKHSYFKLGFHLNEFKTNKYYEDFGYLTFEEFCSMNFEMDKSAISRCINVFLMTTSYGEEKYSCGLKSIGCASVMSDKYKDFSYSQLCEMLPLDDEKRKQVKPSMTVKEIRALKNKIDDIASDKVKAFVEYFRNDVTSFTRENLMQVFIENGSSYSSTYGGCVEYDFKPGKVRIGLSEYHAFPKILDYYEECGGTYESEPITIDCNSPVAPELEEDIVEVAFKGEELGSSEFVSILWDKLEEVINSLSDDIFDCKRSGKSFEIETLSGDKYKLLYMVGKKKTN